MTDDKVTLAALHERAVPTPEGWRGLVPRIHALQAERDKLSAGMTAANEEKCRQMDLANAARMEAHSLRAKLTALVEASEWFKRRRQSITHDVSSAHSGRGNGASQWMREDDSEFRRDMREAFERLEQALAHHSAPVGEADGGQDRKFAFRNGQFVNRVSGEPIPKDEPIIIFRARDRHALSVLEHYLGLAQDPHHQQAIRERIAEFQAYREANPERLKEPGITRDITLSAPPTTPTSAPVEDVGGLLRKHMEASGTCVWDREPDGEGTDWCGYLSYAERDAFLAALSPSLIQPADPTEGCPISSDGPHAITEHRRWLARQLLDSKLDDAEAFGIVRHFPAITDLIQPQGEERS